ncbi:hypothetical protein CHOED_030 [Vibrio phage CHOED]|uniref:hypothetical protein n=1 Tax=Vibrio phage CHOED TaxID=1458716 RepID=UPI00042F1255|nr:hypothetical protein CHOED_030 [Vibrio phage CHOED]AHK11890.1 putative membrane protein [Vibrio phage CHOED]
MKTVNVTNNSIGPIGLLWVVVATLKLMAIIDWSWWIVVFFPVLAGLGIFSFMAVITLITGGLIWAACRN